MNESRFTSATLLLVDDDPSIIQAASRLLSEFGRCRFARSAADALRLLRREPVDLVLLDAEMTSALASLLKMLLRQCMGTAE
jgi:CheY-like chemotaxis protein